MAISEGSKGGAVATLRAVLPERQHRAITPQVLVLTD